MKLDSLKLKGTEVALRNSHEIVERPSVLKKLDAMYDEHAKLVFMFDVSGSMSARVAHTFAEQYNWTPEILTGIRAAVAAVIAKVNPLVNDLLARATGYGLDENESNALRLADRTRGANNEYTFNPKDDEDLEERVVRADLVGAFGVTVNWEKHSKEPPTRMQLVKTLAKSELENRFKKFPNSKIAVIPFGSQPVVMFNDGVPAELWPLLDEMDLYYKGAGGGTDILSAIKQAMDVCRANPSPVGIHHFIMVSDGEDEIASRNLPRWIPTLKASGVVFDYIHIGDDYRNAGMEQVCKETGGECVTVNSERELRAKFVEAINRKMLPPAK